MVYKEESKVHSESCLQLCKGWLPSWWGWEHLGSSSWWDEAAALQLESSDQAPCSLGGGTALAQVAHRGVSILRGFKVLARQSPGNPSESWRKSCLKWKVGGKISRVSSQPILLWFSDIWTYEPCHCASDLKCTRYFSSLFKSKIHTSFLPVALQSSVQEVYSKPILLPLPRTVCIQVDVPDREACWGWGLLFVQGLPPPWSASS